MVRSPRVGMGASVFVMAFLTYRMDVHQSHVKSILTHPILGSHIWLGGLLLTNLGRIKLEGVSSKESMAMV